MTTESLQEAYDLLKTESEVRLEIAGKIKIEKEIAKMLRDALENPKK